MKTKPPKTGVREKKRHALFMRRTYSVYKHMQERYQETHPNAKLLFVLENIREMVLSAVRGRACRYCGVAITEKNFSLDHLTPVERDGGWTITNLQVIDRSCNLAKGRMTHEEFSSLMRMLREEFPPEIMREVIGRLKAGASVVRLRFLGRKNG